MRKSVFLLTTLPVLIGMALRAWRPVRVRRIEPVAGRIATGLFLLIVLATFWSQRGVLAEHLGGVGLAALALNAAALAGAWGLGSQAGLDRRDRIAVATECGLQNSALGIYVCVELLRQPALYLRVAQPAGVGLQLALRFIRGLGVPGGWRRGGAIGHRWASPSRSDPMAIVRFLGRPIWGAGL